MNTDLNLENFNNYSKNSMFFSFFILVVIIFGFWGTRSQITQINETNQKIKETTAIFEDIKLKKEQITNTEKQVQTFTAQERYLAAAIPLKFDNEDYVNELVDATSNSNYKLEKINFNTGQGNEDVMTVVVTFSNKNSESPEELIKGLEKTRILSKINSITYNTNGTNRNVQVTLEVYKIGKAQ